MRKVHTNYPLLNHNTFGVENNAEYFSEPSDLNELRDVLKYIKQRSLDYLVIGEGSNLLFLNDIKGMVIHPLFKGVQILDESTSELLIRVGAGENWDEFVATCVKNQWYGTENLSLIPGSVGSAPVQNIGAYGREVKELIEHVEVFDSHTMQEVILSNQACEFGYRDSIFKHGEQNRYIVTRVVFKLSKSSEFLLEYGNVKEEFHKKKAQTLETLRETIIEIRESKLPNYQKFGNGGSFFKNPLLKMSRFEELNKEGKIPFYPADGPNVKIPAAWLIDQCGWKDKRIGNVGCWPLQPLVIVNYGNATGKEIYQFSKLIADSVQEKFKISLEREVKIVGDL